jgi:hypothetical protein
MRWALNIVELLRFMTWNTEEIKIVTLNHELIIYFCTLVKTFSNLKSIVKIRASWGTLKMVIHRNRHDDVYSTIEWELNEVTFWCIMISMRGFMFSSEWLLRFHQIVFFCIVLPCHGSRGCHNYFVYTTSRMKNRELHSFTLILVCFLLIQRVQGLGFRVQWLEG